MALHFSCAFASRFSFCESELPPALLHKSSDRRGSPFPGQTYPKVVCDGYAVMPPFSWPSRIWLRRSGNTGRSPKWLQVNSTARTSSVSSSIPRWILRHTRRLGRRACADVTRPRLDPHAADQQVQWAPIAPIRDIHRRCLQARGQRA